MHCTTSCGSSAACGDGGRHCSKWVWPHRLWTAPLLAHMLNQSTVVSMGGVHNLAVCGVAVSPLAVNPVVWLKWVDLDITSAHTGPETISVWSCWQDPPTVSHSYDYFILLNSLCRGIKLPWLPPRYSRAPRWPYSTFTLQLFGRHSGVALSRSPRWILLVH